MTEDRVTPLLELHRSLGARLVDFAGWEMPLQYEGVIAEHNAVRNAVGVFDVSHLGKLLCAGDRAGTALQHALTADVEGLEVGRARYSLVLTEDGGCVDDVFVYRLGADEWMVVPNAANNQAVADHIGGSGMAPDDVWDRWAILALQGPGSFDTFERVWPGAGGADMKLHSFKTVEGFDAEMLVARTGYTGERGFELYVPSPVAERVFTALLDAGASPVGLGARDTLRLEMGYALYGHEIDLQTDPLSAGLGWAISWDKDFRGKTAVEKIRADGPPKRLRGIRCGGRGVPRQGHEVLSNGDKIGDVVSGNYSPTLQTGIAMAYFRADAAPEEGAKVAISARGRSIEGDIVKPPFVTRR